MYKIIKNIDISNFTNVQFRILVLIIFFSFFYITSYSQKIVTEYQLKALYLLNFPLLTEWPSNSSVNDKNKLFVITIVGENPFKGKLRNTIRIKNKKLKNKSIIVKQVNDIKDISKPNIIFISSSKKYEISKIIDYLKEKPILTIGDTKSYANKGVMINMFITKSTIKFNINLKEAKASEIYISSRLLASASKIYK